jgi:hypothetical protein
MERLSRSECVIKIKDYSGQLSLLLLRQLAQDS